MITYVAKCAAISWLMAVSLGFIFGGAVMHNFSIEYLWVTAVIPVSLIFSSIVALFFTPLTVWALRGGFSIKRICFLWLLLIAYILIVAQYSGPIAICGSLVLALGGMIAVRFWGRK